MTTKTYRKRYSNFTGCLCKTSLSPYNISLSLNYKRTGDRAYRHENENEKCCNNSVINLN